MPDKIVRTRRGVTRGKEKETKSDRRQGASKDTKQGTKTGVGAKLRRRGKEVTYRAAIFEGRDGVFDDLRENVHRDGLVAWPGGTQQHALEC